MKCRSGERGTTWSHKTIDKRILATFSRKLEMDMEGEKDLDVVEVDEADAGHDDGVVPSTEPLDCSGSSRSSSGSNGSITPPTDLKVKPKVRFCETI